ncbi:MAG: NAD(P)-dependent oxidoreductase [Bacteroidales bacterium]
MKKVLVATEKPFAPTAVNQIKEIIEKAGHELILLEKYKEKDELIKAALMANAMIVRSDIVTKEILEACSSLELVVRAGAGFDNIDFKTAAENNIVVMNTPGQNSNAVAELVFGLMIYHARKCFNGAIGTEIRGKTIGIHAYGNIGKLVGKIAKGFGMKVFAFDPFIPAEIIEKDRITPVIKVEELYKNCQYISLQIPSSAETKKSINYSLLSLMPKDAVLVNTARKDIINEPDILKMMTERSDFSYLSDFEPDNKSDLEKFSGRLLITAKKMGAQTEEANINAGIAAANQIVSYFATGDVRFKVN